MYATRKHYVIYRFVSDTYYNFKYNRHFISNQPCKFTSAIYNSIYLIISFFVQILIYLKNCKTKIIFFYKIEIINKSLNDISKNYQ